MSVTNAERQRAYRERKKAQPEAPNVVVLKPHPLLSVVDELWEARLLSSAARIRLRAEIKRLG